MSTVLASAADERYGYHLLNLIGSVKANSDVFDRIVVYDLGLSPLQRRLVDGVRGIEVRTVPPFVPPRAQCFTWKLWIWTHLEVDQLFWLDAGVTVLRPADGGPLEQIGEARLLRRLSGPCKPRHRSVRILRTLRASHR